MKIFRSILLFTLCFYTHIGTSWFLLLSLFAFSLAESRTRKAGLIVSLATLALFSPIFIQQLCNIKSISISPLYEKYFCEYKMLDYLLAALGFVLVLRKKKKYILFAAFFIISFIYINYPNRFFSSEGYLAISLLTAVSLDSLWENCRGRKLVKALGIFSIAFMLIISPTFVAGQNSIGLPEYNLFIFDSAVMNMVFPEANKRMVCMTLWFKDYYGYAAEIIRENSSQGDIVYSTNQFIGACLASISERATANGLLPEVFSPRGRDSFADSKIIVMLKDDSPERAKAIVKNYRLILIGKSEIFDIYKNPFAKEKMRVKKAIVPFGLILGIFILWAIAFLTAKGKNRLT